MGVGLAASTLFHYTFVLCLRDKWNGTMLRALFIFIHSLTAYTCDVSYFVYFTAFIVYRLAIVTDEHKQMNMGHECVSLTYTYIRKYYFSEAQ